MTLHTCPKCSHEFEDNAKSKILDMAMSSFTISFNQVREYTKFSDVTVAKAFKDLVNEKKLTFRKIGRRKYYIFIGERP